MERGEGGRGGGGGGEGLEWYSLKKNPQKLYGVFCLLTFVCFYFIFFLKND